MGRHGVPMGYRLKARGDEAIRRALAAQFSRCARWSARCAGCAPLAGVECRV